MNATKEARDGMKSVPGFSYIVQTYCTSCQKNSLNIRNRHSVSAALPFYRFVAALRAFRIAAA